MKTSIKFFLSLTFLLLTTCLTTSIFAQEYGMASYYADQYEGKKTASGELYRKAKMTCAHKSLLFGSIVRVTRLDNNKSVEVRVNDRGPYIKGRIVDLSRAAATELGIIQLGESKVKVELLKKTSVSPPVAVAPKPKPRPQPKPQQPVVMTGKGTNTTLNVEAPSTQTKVTPKPKPVEQPVVRKVAPTVAPDSYEVAERVTKKNYSDFDLYQIKVMRPKKQGFGVQVSSLLAYKNVMRMIAQLQESGYENVLMSVEERLDGKPKYKIIVGPFATKDQANRTLKRLKKKKYDGFVMSLNNLVH